jgi:hypothetical protein
MKELPMHIIEKYKKYGRRNIAILTIAPIGSGSIMYPLTSPTS